eukprot:9503991-Pyramimonas_sp.AAC.1
MKAELQRKAILTSEILDLSCHHDQRARQGSQDQDSRCSLTAFIIWKMRFDNAKTIDSLMMAYSRAYSSAIINERIDPWHQIFSR